MSKLKYKVYNGKKIKGLIRESDDILFLLLFISGIIIGAYSSGKAETIKDIAIQYLNFRKSIGFSEQFLKSVLVNVIFIAVSFFLGFSLIGSPMIYCLLFVRGMGTGAICGFLYSEYGFSGIGYAALTFFPSIVISVYSLMMSCKISSAYSYNAFAKAIRGRGQYENAETKLFVFRQLICMIIAVFSSVIDSLFAMLFSRFFAL